MAAPNEHTRIAEHNVTRRNFFRMAVGSFVTLPAVAGGFLVEMPTAYADEPERYFQQKDGGQVDNTITEIVLVAGYQLGVKVADAATGGRDPIPGAHVYLTSRYNGKTVDDYTPDNGIVTLDISELAEDLEGVGPENLSTYAFNGTITVTCPGYREYKMALTRLTGGGGVTVSTRSLSDGASDPYPRTVSFNEWDVLYNTDNEFLTTSKNDAEQNLSLEFLQMPVGAATVLLKDRNSGETLMTTTSNVGDDGILNASFVGKYLQAGTEGALPEKRQYDIEVVQGENHILCPIKLAVKKGVADDETRSDKYLVRPIDTSLTSTTMAQIKWPKEVPIVGGGEIKGFSPDFYVNQYFNPLGYYQLTLKTPAMGYYRDSGHEATDKGQGWQTFPCKFPDKWWDDGVKGIEDGLARAKQGAANGMETYTGRMTAGSLMPIETFASIKTAVNLQLCVIAKWSEETAIFQGMAAGQVFVAIITCISENFWLGCVPVLISFDFNFSSTITLSAGFYTAPDSQYGPKELSLDTSKWKWDYSNTGFTFTFNLIPSLSVGVGVRGIGSVSVKGTFQLTVSFGLTYKGSMSSSTYELPHIIAGYAAQIAIVISMFFFSTSYPLKSWKYRTFCDNWEENEKKGAVEAAADEAVADWRRSAEDLSLEEIVGRLKIIDDATLGRTSEFNGAAALSAQAEGEPFNWEKVRKEDRVVKLDNGQEITYKVYSMKTQDVNTDSLTGQSEDKTQEDSAKEDAAADAAKENASASVREEPMTSDSEGVEQATPAAVDNEGAMHELPRTGESESGTQEPPMATATKATSETPDERNESGLQAAAEAPAAAEVPVAAEAKTEEVFAPRYPSPVQYESTTTVAEGLTAMADGEAPLQATPKAVDVSNHGGIILDPATDKIIAGNVFGDPRLKVATLNTNIGGTNLRVTCSFRIGVVTIDGQRRSRVIMTVIDAGNADGTSDAAAKRYIGTSKPIDFEFMGLQNVMHAGMYDYEFDTVFTTISAGGGTIDMIHLVVVSGLREHGDATSIADASTDLVFSYVNFRAADAFGNPQYLVKSVSAMTVLGDGNYDNKYHCVSNVRIGTDGTEESFHLLIGMLDRASDKAEAVLTDNYGDGTNGTVKTSVVFAILDQRAQEWLVPDRSNVEDAMNVALIESGTILGMNISPKIQDAYTVTLTSTEETYFFVVKLDEELAVFKSIKMAPMLESGMRLVPWPQQNCFLTTYPTEDYLQELNESGEWKNPDNWDRSRWALQKAWWEEELDNPADPTSGTPILHFSQIGPENFNIDTFGINSSGTFIFWPQGREGNDGRIYDDSGNSKPLDESDTHLYQLMGARIYKEHFSDPFPVAEVDHHMSDVVIVASRDRLSPLEVLSVEQLQSDTDSEGNPVYLHHEANVWYTAVPHVICATVVDCYAPVPFVSAGGTLAFNVTIRNDGNCFIKGCTLQLCLHETTVDENGKTVATASASRVEGSVARLEIGKDTLLESHFNPKNNDTGELEDVEVDFTLAPGKRSVYQAQIPIPKDWEEGSKFVSLVASVSKETDVADGGSLSAMAEGDDIVYQEFGVEPGSYRPYLQRSTPDVDENRTHMDVITVDAGSSIDSNLADAPLTLWTGGSGYDPYGQGGSSSTPKNGAKNGVTTNTRSDSKIPRTGDPFSGVAAGIAAAAGVALTAYGARRARNAKNDEPSEEA